MIANKVRRLSGSAMLLLGGILSASCSRAPSFDVLGSLFPAWLLCLALGLLCAAALQPGCAPKIEVPVQQAGKGSAERMTPCVQDKKFSPHWQDEFDKLEPDQADALAGMLFHIALSRNFIERDSHPSKRGSVGRIRSATAKRRSRTVGSQRLDRAS